MTEPERQKVFDKTGGHCHFCGDRLELDDHASGSDGAWELDHVVQRGKGGWSSPENYLPACGKCNHLRWHRTGDDLRELILLGLVAKDEIKKKTDLGKRIDEQLKKRLARNEQRRKKRRAN